MWDLTAKLEQLPALEFVTYPRELEAGRPTVYLAPSVDSKPQIEDQGQVDEEGGHLYNHIKMLYEEDLCLEPVLWKMPLNL